MGNAELIDDAAHPSPTPTPVNMEYTPEQTPTPPSEDERLSPTPSSTTALDSIQEAEKDYSSIVADIISRTVPPDLSLRKNPNRSTIVWSKTSASFTVVNSDGSSTVANKEDDKPVPAAPAIPPRRAGWVVPYTPAQEWIVRLAMRGENVFIHGEAGVGKTETLLAIVQILRQKGKVVGARTVDTCECEGWLCSATRECPRKPDKARKRFVENALSSPAYRKMWQSRDVFVLDNVNQYGATSLEDMDYMARQLRGDNRPFGGVQVIFAGDFFQCSPCPPVGAGDDCDWDSKKEGVRPMDPFAKDTDKPDTATDKQYAFESAFWAECFPPTRCIELLHSFRHTPEWLSVLRAVRMGHMDEHVLAALNALDRRITDPEMRICATRYAANLENHQYVRGFQPGHVHQYEAAHAHFPRQNVHLPDPLPEFFDARMPQPWFLSVKVGTGVVLLVDLPEDEQLKTGARGKIVDFKSVPDALALGIPVLPCTDSRPETVKDTPWPVVEFGLNNLQLDRGMALERGLAAEYARERKRKRERALAEAAAQAAHEEGAGSTTDTDTDTDADTAAAAAATAVDPALAEKSVRYVVPVMSYQAASATMVRMQVPLVVDVTTTIPRAQGLTPASVMVDLSDVRHVDGLAYETAGLAYTALARATDADALWLRGGLPADTVVVSEKVRDWYRAIQQAPVEHVSRRNRQKPKPKPKPKAKKTSCGCCIM